MSDYNHQNYKAFFILDREIEQESKCNRVKVSFQPGAINTETNQLSTKYVEKYKTPPYKTPQQAFAHAYGWVDFMHFDETDSNKEEDSREKAYSEARESQHRISLPQVSEEASTKTLNKKEEKEKEKWEQTLKEAYTEGWKSAKAGGGKKLIYGDVDE